jgi:hypothetical protein
MRPSVAAGPDGIRWQGPIQFAVLEARSPFSSGCPCIGSTDCHRPISTSPIPCAVQSLAPFIFPADFPAAYATARNSSPLVIMAQMTRAILLASATAATV